MIFAAIVEKRALSDVGQEKNKRNEGERKGRCASFALFATPEKRAAGKRGVERACSAALAR